MSSSTKAYEISEQSLPEIRAFETPSSTEQAPNLPGIIFKPNLYISVFDVWQKKIKALEAYEKEIGKFPHLRSVESLKALAIKEELSLD